MGAPRIEMTGARGNVFGSLLRRAKAGAPMVETYTVLKWLHVLAAAYLVGSFVTEYALRQFAARAKREHKAFTWEFLVKGEEKVAIPFALLLLASGLLMVFGPWSGGWSFMTDLWIAGGLAIFLVILVLMAGLAAAAAKRVHAAYTNGGGDEEARPHERRYATLSLASLGLVAVAVWLMVAKPF